MSYLFDHVDFDKTVKDYEFTRMAARSVEEALSSSDLAGMDAAAIYSFLLSRMQNVSFKDYLKRYLYEHTDFGAPFSGVPESDYMETILASFEQNRAPRSFSPTTVRFRTAVTRWLRQDSVRRETVFLLGFGLRMPAEDVSDFLTKVLLEVDYLPDDPWEVICWYSFSKGLSYADAAALGRFYEDCVVSSANDPLFRKGEKIAVRMTAPEETPADWAGYLHTEEEIRSVLYCLKKTGTAEHRRRSLREKFLELYEECLGLIREIYRADETRKPDETAVGSADLERMLCDGMPVTTRGNRRKVASSFLNDMFRQKRVTRQRLESLLKGELEIDRFDLITLQFFLSSQSDEEDGRLRCRYFLDDVNYVLENCGLRDIYPANPYEAFVTMCMATEDPLENYCEVWKLSYEDN